MTNQKLNFAEIYRNCRRAVESSLTSMWIGETLNESQRAYMQQLKEIIREIFAPKDAMPLVECTNPYKSVDPSKAKAAEALVGDLWKKTLPVGKYYPPYMHQRESWNALLNGYDADENPKSIVVTTGTGSGKTECFMLPLVRDIIERGERGKVQAIFLYPLNALMDDQKERLERLVAGTGLRYAVYNGNLAEREDPKSEDAMTKIRLAKGTPDGLQPGTEADLFPNCIATRQELRNNPPEILLTNPTMLEYILLRDQDNPLITEGSLKWVVIDEAHTYNGAGAAELAMLLRRVAIAYGVTPLQMRFAASSATIGNKQSASEKEATMRAFISGITGVRESQVEVIDGEPIDVPTVTKGKYAKEWNHLLRLRKEGTPYIPLDELLKGDDDVESKLIRLEEMCNEAPGKCRIKVHYFFRVPNSGLYVRLSEKGDGCFKIYTNQDVNAPQGGDAPLLELNRCKRCGEFIAIARVETGSKTYAPKSSLESDMFDLEPEDNSGYENRIFSLVKNGEIKPGDGNQGVSIIGDQYQLSLDLFDKKDGWEVVMNTQDACPCCGTKLTKHSDDSSDEIEHDGIPDDEDPHKLIRFRVPSDLISRWIAPEILDQVVESKEPRLHRGQQYISFVDSRQAAAQSTLKQNVENERLWVYTTIFHHLSNLTLNQTAALSKEDLNRKLSAAQLKEDWEEVEKLSQQLKALKNQLPAMLRWKEIATLLEEDPMCEIFARQFAKRVARSEDFKDGKVRPDVKKRYVHSIMVEYLAKRPAFAAAPETMGLFTTVYPDIENLRKESLPDAVEAFNASMENDALKISPSDWADFLHVYLDYSVRSNDSIFINIGDENPMDIFKCVRYATQKPRRRPVRKIAVSPKSTSRAVRYLAQLLVEDGQADTISEALSFASDQIQSVIDAMWDKLTMLKLIQIGTYYDEDLGRHVNEKDIIKKDKDGREISIKPYRLNVADICFKLYSKVALADTITIGDGSGVRRLRPVETVFKGYSPYLRNRTLPVKLATEFESWKPYDMGKGISLEGIHKWAEENRSLLWENGLWNDYGTFASRLDDIHQSKELFVQSEHTAQIDKIIARQVQNEFKDRSLNILACSTTMEMGVDLGNLEVVMLSSVPPMPSNYKQRAGRSGRNDMIKSVAITLCGSDSLGLRTLYDPMGNVIERIVKAPVVDLTSPQVVQRHVNAFLVRESGVFRGGERGGKISQRVFHYYTKLGYDDADGHSHLTKPNGSHIFPFAKEDYEFVVDESGTKYEDFNKFCETPLPPEVQCRLKTLLRGTRFESELKTLIDKAADANRDSRDEMLRRIEFVRAYKAEDLSKSQQNFFTMKFLEPLMSQLIEFWARTRFTSNANMPVNVVSFDITSGKKQHYTSSTSNPSYDLTRALAQYVPGNSIILDGRVNVVRGVRYHDFLRKENGDFQDHLQRSGANCD